MPDPTLYVDISDLLAPFDIAVCPPGILRVVAELARALDGRAKFVATNDAGALLLAGRPTVEPFANANAGRLETAGVAGRPARGALHRRMRDLAYKMPFEMRQAALFAYIDQRRAIAAASAQLGKRRRAARQPAAASDRPSPARATLAALMDTVDPGDWLLTPGAPWRQPHSAAAIAKLQSRGVRHALVVHDLIAATQPEWSGIQPASRVASVIGELGRQADAVVVPSAETGETVRRVLAREPLVIPLGSGFTPADAPAEAAAKFGEFVLCVGTIEARKNHDLLLHVWRRMLDQMPPEQVPMLVFAGHVGWAVTDLFDQLRSSRFHDGRIAIFHAPSDAELEGLYRACLFTVCPSHREGSAFAVSESLAFGVPCIASSGTAANTSAQNLARVFPAGDMNAAAALIREAIEDRSGLANWRNAVVRDFHRTPWSDTASAILTATLGRGA